MYTARRNILKAVAAVGAAAMLAPAELLSQFVRKSTARGGRIDVHHHTSPPALRTGPQIPAGTPGSGLGTWTPEQSLEQMDKFDIAVSILSMTQMGDLLYDGTEKGAAAVRIGNDYGAKLMSEHPKRFGLFTSVPLHDIASSEAAAMIWPRLAVAALRNIAISVIQERVASPLM